MRRQAGISAWNQLGENWFSNTFRFNLKYINSRKVRFTLLEWVNTRKHITSWHILCIICKYLLLFTLKGNKISNILYEHFRNKNRFLTAFPKYCLPADGKEVDPAMLDPGDREVTQLVNPAGQHGIHTSNQGSLCSKVALSQHATVLNNQDVVPYCATNGQTKTIRDSTG